MSRLGAAGAVAPLVTDIPISSVEVVKIYTHNLYIYYSSFSEFCGLDCIFIFYASILEQEDGGEVGRPQPAWEKWSNDGTERQVAKLMEENVGAAMQFLQSKALCIMPISLASAIYHTQPPETTSLVKPEINPPP